MVGLRRAPLVHSAKTQSTRTPSAAPSQKQLAKPAPEASAAPPDDVSADELAEFAEFMEVDPLTEAFLLPIVVEAMKAPLPTHWKEFEDP